MKKIDLKQFIETYNQLSDRFEEIRKLYSPNLYPLDSIEVDGEQIVFSCSESFRGSTDYESYSYTQDEINRPNDEWIAIIAENKKQAEIKQQKDKKVFEEQKRQQRKDQFEQLKKEFGN